MFSGDHGHPQGVGPYVFAEATDKSFVVQTCHKRINSVVSYNWRLAVKAPDGVYKKLGGSWQKPQGAVATCTSTGCTWPTGEVVSLAGSAAYVKFPGTYCGRVQGLCGAYTPDKSFRDAYTAANGRIIDVSQGAGQPYRWGGPFYGRYQYDFADSYKPAYGSPQILFS